MVNKIHLSCCVLSLGYHCEYKKRTGKKPDGCAVVFKQDSFSLVSCHPVEYFKPGIPLLDRDNVGLVLLLQPKVEKGITNHLCVANTHLLYNPRRGDIKLAQLGLLLAEISHVAKQSDGTTCPVILCGDFNSAPWSPLYHFIRESKLEYHGIPMGKVRTCSVRTKEHIRKVLKHPVSIDHLYNET